MLRWIPRDYESEDLVHSHSWNINTYLVKSIEEIVERVYEISAQLVTGK